jgi:hypothetical protein
MEGLRMHWDELTSPTRGNQPSLLILKTKENTKSSQCNDELKTGDHVHQTDQYLTQCAMPDMFS